MVAGSQLQSTILYDIGSKKFSRIITRRIPCFCAYAHRLLFFILLECEEAEKAEKSCPMPMYSHFVPFGGRPFSAGIPRRAGIYEGLYEHVSTSEYFQKLMFVGGTNTAV